MHTRRHCLASALSVASIVGVGGWPWHAEAEVDTNLACAQVNLLRLAPQAQAAPLGEAILLQLERPTARSLVESLASRLSEFFNGNLHQFCDANLLQLAFQEAVRTDFAHGRCREISGWVLARTEVELYALAAVSANTTRRQPNGPSVHHMHTITSGPP